MKGVPLYMLVDILLLSVCDLWASPFPSSEDRGIFYGIRGHMAIYVCHACGRERALSLYRTSRGEVEVTGMAEPVGGVYGTSLSYMCLCGYI